MPTQKKIPHVKTNRLFRFLIQPYRCLIYSERMDNIQIGQTQDRVYQHSVLVNVSSSRKKTKKKIKTNRNAINGNESKRYSDKRWIEICAHTSALLDGADAEPSKWLYSWLSTSRSLLTLFLFGWIKIAWKLTGKPYLRTKEK